MKWRYVVFLLFSIFIFLSSSAWLIFVKPLPISSVDTVYIIEPGHSLVQIATELHEQHWLPYPRLFIALAVLKGDASRLQAGEYALHPGMRMPELLTHFVKGEVILHPLRIGEGWTFQMLADTIAANPYLTHTLDFTQPKQLVQSLGLTAVHPEGLFFPDTYYFRRGDTDAAFLKRAASILQRYLAKAWETRANDLPYTTPYQALIAASIVEKESGCPAELAQISGVIMRRLEKHMLLQMDPSVIYGLGPDFKPPLSDADLKKDTPYNTYLYSGLPPTPIATPSIAAINAALHPDASAALYFVARGDGCHTFSNTLADHQKAVLEYRKLQ